MKTRPPFLTAEWRKLIMASYPVDPMVLRPYLPAYTELDEWKGQTYVSLVGFMFRQVRVKGLRVPYHTDFPEVNLRFYVRHRQDGQWKRGVVFINEVVPKPAITWVANTLFREHYKTLPMRYEDHTEGKDLRVSYQWKYREHWNRLTVDADAVPAALPPESKEEFITEHFWGYASMGPASCGEYEVAHPRWNIHPVKSHDIVCDFGGLYGETFAGLSGQEPASVFLAEGSAIKVYPKKRIG
ncbi:MAG TPA: DUF2071 domain-containing protein [Puia sp.]